jgi:hypothetical protein
MDPHHFDPNPDPTFHPDADPDPDPDPCFQIKAQTFEMCPNRLIFHTFWFVICKLMRIQARFRIQLITLNADPDPDFYLMRIWMRIQIRIFI